MNNNGDNMKSRNAEFFDKYKALDKMCSEIYGGSNGVTQYIDDMNSVPYSQSRNVAGWDKTIQELKKYRHFRNELAHGALDMEDDNCSDEDIRWVSEFRDKIMNCDDPIARLRKIKEENSNKKPASGAKTAIKTSTQSSSLNTQTNNKSVYSTYIESGLSNSNNNSSLQKRKAEQNSNSITNIIFTILISLVLLGIIGFMLILKLIFS